MRRFRRLIAAAVGLTAGLLVLAAPAGAHPLGNFTINHYARVELSAGVVRVYYVLDEAEIPTFQEGDAPHRGQGWQDSRAEAIRSHLSLTVDGLPVMLRVANAVTSFPAGQGGLHTLRLAIRFDGALPAGSAGQVHDGTFSDGNEPARIGWREIVIAGRGGATISDTRAPSRDVSDELRHYPADLVQAPLDLRSATFRFTPGAAAEAVPITGQAAAPARYGGRFTALIQRTRVTPLVLLGMLAIALAFGAAHALAPGHGKTVMAAYLVGTGGRPQDAVLLGAIVSVMHTASVLVLGAILYEVSRSTAPDQIYPWLQLASGVAVALFGAWLLATRLRGLRQRRSPARHAHDGHAQDGHAQDGHAHDGHAGHFHGRGHDHALPDGVAPLSGRGLVLLATTGGLFPSPSALIVLLASFELGRVALGLTLIAAFSVGLAATLTGVGLALVYGRGVVERRGLLPALRVLPALSAGAITTLGLVYAVTGAHALR